LHEITKIPLILNAQKQEDITLVLLDDYVLLNGYFEYSVSLPTNTTDKSAPPSIKTIGRFHEKNGTYYFRFFISSIGFLTNPSGGGKIKRKWSKRRRLRLLKKRVSRKRRRRRSKGQKA
jgi:hypothetical protein